MSLKSILRGHKRYMIYDHIYIYFKKNLPGLVFAPVCACVHAQLHNCVQPFATLWTIAHQTPVSMRFPRQEYWSGLPFPSPSDLPDPGIKPGSPALQADSSLCEPPCCIFLVECASSLSSGVLAMGL